MYIWKNKKWSKPPASLSLKQLPWCRSNQHLPMFVLDPHVTPASWVTKLHKITAVLLDVDGLHMRVVCSKFQRESLRQLLIFAPIFEKSISRSIPPSLYRQVSSASKFTQNGGYNRILSPPQMWPRTCGASFKKKVGSQNHPTKKICRKNV
jgi:hypothetical protein